MRRPHPIQWIRDHPDVADALLAAALSAMIVVSLLGTDAGQSGASNRDPDALAVVFALVQAGAVAWRRRQPLRALWIAVATLVPFWVLDYVDTGVSVPVLVLLYSVAAHVDRPRAIRHAASASALLVLVTLVGVVVAADDVPAIAVVANTVIFATAWILGDSLRNRRDYLASVEARAEQAEADRETAADRAAEAERTRIARELHDVVAHSVSVMVVQAGAARRVIDRHPEQTVESLGIIERTGRDALDELRRVLGVLRSDSTPSTAPQPTARDIDDLVQQWRAAGMTVTLRSDGAATDLAPGVGLTVYRLVQEALTNVMKHAGPASVTVDLRYRPDSVSIVVTDDGRGPHGPTGSRSPVSGHGLIGMRERVELFGGQLDVGARPGGGFQVRATLPVPATPVPSHPGP